jgi:hypothetical protein
MIGNAFSARRGTFAAGKRYPAVAKQFLEH